MITVTIGNKHIGTIEYKHTEPDNKLKRLAKEIEAMANTKEWKDYIGNLSKSGRGYVKKAKRKH